MNAESIALEAKPLSLPRRMLSLLGEGGIATTSDLARRLAVSEEMIGMMAEEMTRRGYLARMNSCSGGGCAACHVASACAPADAAKGALLILTLKGRQAASE